MTFAVFPLLELQKHSDCSVRVSSSTNDLWSWITTETNNSQVLFSLFINLLPELRLINDSWYELQPEMLLLYCRLCKGEQRYTGSKLRLEIKISVEGSIFDQVPSLSAEAEVWWRWRSNKTQQKGERNSLKNWGNLQHHTIILCLSLWPPAFYITVIWSIFTIEILISAALTWRITHHFIFYSLVPSSQTALQQPSNRDIKSLEKHITAAEMKQRVTTPHRLIMSIHL